MRFFATAAKGTEPALRDELRELRVREELRSSGEDGTGPAAAPPRP